LSDAAFDAHRGVLDDIADSVRCVGEFGAGTALKPILAPRASSKT
jgi:hypothetical protein